MALGFDKMVQSVGRSELDGHQLSDDLVGEKLDKLTISAGMEDGIDEDAHELTPRASLLGLPPEIFNMIIEECQKDWDTSDAR